MTLQVPQLIGASTKPVLVVEDGGHIAGALYDRRELPVPVRFVEQTTKGLRVHEAFIRHNAMVLCPVLSIPDATSKRTLEPPLIADQVVVENLRRLMPGWTAVGQRVLVMGGGTIGQAICRCLRSNGASVQVYDPSVQRQLELTLEHGPLSVASSAVEAAREASLIIGCVGAQSIGTDVIHSARDGRVLASASSDKVEIDLASLSVEDPTPEHFFHVSEPDVPARSVYRIRGKKVTLLASGYPVNFFGPTGMVPQGGDMVMSLMLAASAELAFKAAFLPNGILRTKADEIARVYELLEELQRQHFR